MITYLKLLPRLLFYILTNNPTKMIVLVIGLILFHYAGSFPDSKIPNYICGSIKINNEQAYITQG